MCSSQRFFVTPKWQQRISLATSNTSLLDDAITAILHVIQSHADAVCTFLVVIAIPHYFTCPYAIDTALPLFTLNNHGDETLFIRAPMSLIY